MLLEIHSGLIIWTIITFVLLVMILRAVAWKPIIGALDARDEALAEVKREAEEGLKESRQLLEEHRALISKAEMEAAEILVQAREAAERVGREIAEKSRADSEEAQKRATREIEAAKASALRDVRDTIADLALTAAGRILDETLDQSRHQKLVDDMIAQIPTEPTV